MKYFFALGTNPALSIAEIGAALGQKVKVIDYSAEILIIDSADVLEVVKLQERFGGTIKIGEIWDEYDQVIVNLIVGKIIETVSPGTKVQFGASLYNLADNLFWQRIKSEVRNLGATVKKQLREKGFSARFVLSKENILSSVAVDKNHLIDRGAEIVIIPRKNRKIYLGRTLTVQDFEKFSRFDYGRPARDDYSGMIPPKLAMMMNNLARISPDDRLLDPFCGSGTILQAAALVGYKNLMGSDISNKAVEDSKENFIWLINEAQLLFVNYHLQKINVEKLSQKIQPDSIDAIVTEPYLGPPLRGRESLAEILRNKKVLEKLYLKALSEFYLVLKSGARAVMVSPVFYADNKKIFLDLAAGINGLKFKIINPLTEFIPRGDKKFKEFLREDSIVYHRENQKVGREIIVLEKSNSDY